MKDISEKMRWVLLLSVLLVCSSVQVVSASGGYAYATQWGSSGQVGGNFNQPYSVAVDSAGTVYVADTLNHRIQKFNSTGGFILKWGSTNAKPGNENGNFSQPSGIAVDSVGNVYVADTMNNRIQKFTSTGGFITKWGSSGLGDRQFNEPRGVAVDSAGNVYVADTFNQRIQKFNSTGGFILKWGNPDTTPLSGDGRFNQPTGVAVDNAGNVYVADMGNHRIQKFTSSGTFITKWGNSTTLHLEDGQFDQSRGVAVDSAGNVFVTDAGLPNRVQKFNSTGGFITKWGSYGTTGDGKFNQPTGIAVDSAGNVYVADLYNSRIQVFAPTIPPAANFTANVTNGPSPLTVGFTDTSTGSVTSRLWSFGDETTSTEQNPAHLFNLPGAYNVSLTATNAYGNTTQNRTGYITVISNPSITAISPSSVSSRTASFDLTLTGQSLFHLQGINLTRAGSANLTGSAITSNADYTSVSCHFDLSTAVPGVWSVNLTTGDGQSTSLVNGLLITVNPVITSVSPASASGNGPATLTLNGIDFYDLQSVKLTRSGYPEIIASAIAYQGSGNTSVACVFDLTDAEPGLWSVNLTPTGGATASKANAFTVNSSPVISAIDPSEGHYGSVSAQVTIAGTGFINTPSAATVLLTAPNNSVVTAGGVQFGSSSSSIAINFTFPFLTADPGTWQVRVKNGDGQVSNTMSLVVHDGTVVPVITANITSGNNPLTVQFTDTSTGVVRSRSWDFGDRTAVSTALNSSHTFTIPGNFTVTLTVFNDDNPTGVNASTAIHVISVPTITGCMPASGQVGTWVSLHISGQQFVNSGDLLHVNLTKSGEQTINGTVVSVTAAGIDSTFMIPADAKPGDWTLTVMNSDDAVATWTRTFTVSAPPAPQPTTVPPRISAFAPPGGVTGAGVSVVVDGSNFQPGIALYLVRDGSIPIVATSLQSTGTQISGVFSLAGAGTGAWNVLVVNPDGGTSARGGAFTVTTPGNTTPVVTPAVGFSVNVTSGLSPLAVQFNESTTGSVQYFFWQFGDGSISLDQNPIHVYDTAGSYTISLFAIGSNGTQVKTADKYINVTDPVTSTPTVTATSTETSVPTAVGYLPVANFTVTPQGGLGSMSILVADTSVNATLMKYDLGDGTTTAYPNFRYTYWQAGTYTIKQTATSAIGSSTWIINVTVPAVSPPIISPTVAGTLYNGPHSIPGLLQAEDFDLGGEDVAYHDTTRGNEGGVYRQDDVDIEVLDTDRSPNVGWIRTGEWLAYTVNIGTAGTYNAGFRVASNCSASHFGVYVDDGTTPVATVNIPNTGDWPVFQTVSVPVTLPAGTHRLKLSFPTDFVNINWISFAQRGGV